MKKAELRSQIKIKRKELVKCNKLDIISNKIVQNIVDSKIFKNASNIALYYPLEGEIDLRELLKNKDKTFYFPKCIENNLYFAKYDGNFKKGCFGVYEPVSGCINPNILDVIFIPALCCNEQCYRLGYGKGFYDRFFRENKINAKKIIISAKCFITNEFVQDDYDYKCDYILCEDGFAK